jgi:phosphate/sulfate permease
MKRNLGTIDRALRVIIGLGLIAYGIVNHSGIGAIGAVPLLTAVIGFCPAYCPLGLSTRKCCK